MKILHLEDNPRDAALAKDLLETEWPGCFITVVESRPDFVSMLQLGGFDLVLSDFQLPGFNGLEALQLVRELSPATPFVFFSGTLGEESAIDAVRAGAADYVVKDRMQRLPMAVHRVLREAADQRRRHQMEAALAQEQYLLRLLMEHLPDHVYFKDTQSAYISVSKSKAGSHGLTPDEMKGRSDFEVFGREHARRAFDDEQRIIRTGEPLLDAEEKIVWPDGRVSWMLATKLPLRDAAGQIVGTFGISRDITARKLAEEQVRDQAEIINAAPIAILIADLDGRVTYCNQGAATLYGVSREEILGRTAADILAPESLAPVRACQRETQAAGRWTGQLPLATRQGRAFVAEVHMSLIRDASGQPRARLTIAIDVTEKKKLEEQFLRAQRLESIGMLAAGIAHDLNNILAPILMGAPLLQSGNLPPADLRVVDAIESSAARGAALVRQILSFAHGASGEQVLVQAKHVIRDVAGLAEQSFPKSIRIEVDVPFDLYTIRGNPTQLHQVMLNLCVNARDAMPAGGVLRIGARNEVLDADGALAVPGARPGSFLVIEVADTGTGIAPDVLDRIWDPFFTTKGAGKGTGLGLATVRGIVATHGGFVALTTAVGAGTTFRIYLPAAEPELFAPREQPDPKRLAARGTGELVLVVDDEESIRDLAAAILSRFGYRVLTAENGAEALRLYQPRTHEIALVVTDLGMPEMDGAALAAELQRLQPQVRVMFMTGGEVLGATPAGNQPSLQKPFLAEHFLARVQEALVAR